MFHLKRQQPFSDSKGGETKRVVAGSGWRILCRIQWNLKVWFQIATN